MSGLNSVLQNIIHPKFLLAAFALLAGVTAMPANAQVIDRIDINQAGNEAEIQIKFVSRIQYLRQVLRSTQTEITKILKDIEEEAPGEDA